MAKVLERRGDHPGLVHVISAMEACDSYRPWHDKTSGQTFQLNDTAHGFRSAFRDWAGNETHFPRELAEHALAHVIGDKAEQAYRRSDALVRWRELMDAWARHCEGGAGENILAFKRPA